MCISLDELAAALAQDRTIDITTIGRRSGRPRRVEIWFHQLDGRVYNSGLPGPRGWYANLLTDPAFVFHLKETIDADLPARARPVLDPAERRTVLELLLPLLGRQSAFDDWLDRSPIVEVTFPSVSALRS